MINVIKKSCAHEDCPTLPSYNYKEYKTPIYCAVHKKINMINVKNILCAFDGCDVHPYFNKEGEKRGKYCLVHKKDNMVNVVSRQCKMDLCDTLIKNKKYEGYCMKCFVQMYPDQQIACNYKTKECATVEHIKKDFPDVDWIFDKRITGGCSYRRPDAILDLGYQLIIVEIDENQHISYDSSCENRRLMEIFTRPRSSSNRFYPLQSRQVSDWRQKDKVLLGF